MNRETSDPNQPYSQGLSAYSSGRPLFRAAPAFSIARRHRLAVVRVVGADLAVAAVRPARRVEELVVAELGRRKPKSRWMPRSHRRAGRGQPSRRGRRACASWETTGMHAGWCPRARESPAPTQFSLSGDGCDPQGAHLAGLALDVAERLPGAIPRILKGRFGPSPQKVAGADLFWTFRPILVRAPFEETDGSLTARTRAPRATVHGCVRCRPRASK